MGNDRDEVINDNLRLALMHVNNAMTLLGETDIRMVSDKGWISAMHAHCDLHSGLKGILMTLSERGVDVRSEFGIEVIPHEENRSSMD